MSWSVTAPVAAVTSLTENATSFGKCIAIMMNKNNHAIFRLRMDFIIIILYINGTSQKELGVKSLRLWTLLVQ